MLFHPEGCAVTVPGRRWLSVMGTKVCRKWGLKVVRSQERGDELSRLNVDSGIPPGTSCPLWQCCCAWRMLCDKVALGKQGDDKFALPSIAYCCTWVPGTPSALQGWLALSLKHEIPQRWRSKCWLSSKLTGPTGKGERYEIVSAEMSLAPWVLGVQLDGWVIPDEHADNSKDYWKLYGLVFHLFILIHFSLHWNVNTQQADGRKAESTHQDEMLIFAWICPCMCWGGSGLYGQPLATVVLGGRSAMPHSACSVSLLCTFLGW